MDEATYNRCFYHLEQAEKCMAESVDGFHFARLSFTVESSKEAYGPRHWPLRPPVSAQQ